MNEQDALNISSWASSTPFSYIIMPIAFMQIFGGLSCIALGILFLVIAEKTRNHFAGFWTGSLMVFTAILRIIYGRLRSRLLGVFLLCFDGAVIFHIIATTLLEVFSYSLFEKTRRMKTVLSLYKLCFALCTLCFVEVIVALWGIFHMLLLLTNLL
ncbi:hypothetical protein CSKR_200772 [Clonorchis sinensis]|uniref:Uncharacterized protein n=1 Tax=Clonorchis sinensis TaxID=79923 RepID=A0A8T1MHA3_CLOSI|nr:hypothetical protein CSKR_200772 [Clonorchis sinensis]